MRLTFSVQSESWPGF